MVQILSITDTGTGSYIFVFSEPVTTTAIATPEPMLQGWSIANQVADDIITIGLNTKTTWTFDTSNATVGLAFWAFVGQPSVLSAAHDFAVAAPITPVT